MNRSKGRSPKHSDAENRPNIPPMKKAVSILAWLLVSLAGAFAYAGIAIQRGEALNSIYILVAALCTYAVGYRFYSKWIAASILALDDRRATPAEVHEDGKDFVKTNKWIVFGHHFAAISGPGPLVGPVLAAQFGYLPGTLWILIGVVLGGAVQDLVILFASLRRDGKSLGQMVKEELNGFAGGIALVAILGIIVILLAVLALVVVRALAESPWGVFTVAATIPIAMFMGGYLRYLRVGKVMEATAIGAVLLLVAVWGGQFVHHHASLAPVFTLPAMWLALAIIVYGLAASVLPVWLLLAPRDYLSTFMKLGTIFGLVLGVFLILPDLKMPSLTQFVDGSGPVVAGKLFPFCFITIACGAISGFHTLIASGTTPKLITRESYVRPVGYGAMCLESLVAMVAMIAACTLEPGIYFAMNVKGPAAETLATVNALGFPVTMEQMTQLAQTVGEQTLFGRTGGATTLAVGMASIFSNAMGGRGLDLWYHFAIMFEALFILTTIDAGTRVGRYLLQDALGAIWKPLGNTRNVGANLFSSTLLVMAWGYFLIQGVRDPLGGINTLWPMFGISNQLLAAIALCLATTILLKMQLRKKQPRLRYALVTFLPLVAILSVTLTTGMAKIFDRDPRIGFLAQIESLQKKAAALSDGRAEGKLSAEVAKALRENRIMQFNNRVNIAVTSILLGLVLIIVAISVREWVLLVARKRLAQLSEPEPVWLPAYELATEKPARLFGLFALAFALIRELSGQSAFDRAHAAQKAEAEASAGETCECAGKTYVAFTTRRFNGINRCC